MIKEYSTSEFKETYTDKSVDKANLFLPGYEDFFCLRLEDIISYAHVPVPPSKEKSHSIIYVTHGVYDFKKGNLRYRVMPNELIVIPAGEVFSIDTIADDLQGYSLHFSPNCFVDSTSAVAVLNNFEFLLPFTNSQFTLTSIKTDVCPIFERLNQLYLENINDNKTLITTYMLVLLYELKRGYTNRDPFISTRYQVLTHRFKQTLFQNFKNLHRTSEYASLLGITPNHLNKVLRNTTNKSPKQWINETIILEAKYLLHQTDLNVSEVSRQLGIFDPSYFSRLFKQLEGVTPSIYQKMIGKS